MTSESSCRSAMVVVTILACAALAGLTPAAAAGPEPTVELRWALGAVTDDGDLPAAISKDTALESGTRLKFLMEPISEGSVYLLLLDSRDEIQVLYRRPTSVDPDRAYIPEGNSWFRLDEDSGKETFFILASAEPLEDLERLLAAYDGSGSSERKELSAAIVGEVRKLHKANRQFARPVEKPVVIGGRTRGTSDPESSIDRLAVEISAEGFYSKTITIDH